MILTPEDKNAVELDVRAANFSWLSPTALAPLIMKGAVEAEYSLRHAPRDINEWFFRGLDYLTDDAVRGGTFRPDPYLHDRLDVLALAVKFALATVDRIESEEDDEDDNTRSAAVFALARKWCAVTPYTVLRYRTFVTESVAIAAKAEVAELLDGYANTTLRDVAREASEKWLAAWKDGVVLPTPREETE